MKMIDKSSPCQVYLGHLSYQPVVKATFRKKLERRDGRTAKGY